MGQQQLLLLILGVVIVGIAVAVGIQLFRTNAESSNRDAIINDMGVYAAQAQAYWRKPLSMGGGGRTFTGFPFPNAGQVNENGTVTAVVAAQQIVFTGIGVETDANNNRVQATYTVTMDVNGNNTTNPPVVVVH